MVSENHTDTMVRENRTDTMVRENRTDTMVRANRTDAMVSENRTEAERLREQLTKARSEAPTRITRDEFIQRANDQLGPLWGALAEHNGVVSETLGQSVEFPFTKIDEQCGLLEGQITFKAPGRQRVHTFSVQLSPVSTCSVMWGRQRVHTFSVQGGRIWVPAFKRKVANKDTDCYTADELPELIERLRVDLVAFLVG
jgi:hypothetical protein